MFLDSMFINLKYDEAVTLWPEVCGTADSITTTTKVQPGTLLGKF